MSRHGKGHDDEMFLTSSSDRDPPTVSPLRIVKRDTPSPGHTTQPSAFSPPPQSPPPHNTLPYPDDRPRPHHMNSFSPSNSRLPYPDHGLLSSTVKHSSKPSSPHYSGSGGSSPADLPPSLRPRERRDSKTAHPSLAERRGTTGPKPLPESPIPQTPDNEGLFQKAPQRPAGGAHAGGMPEQRRKPPAEVNPYPEFHQQYWPAQGNASPSASSKLAAPQPTHSVSRLGSTASTSTTKANRGSPPPPETPIVPPGLSDIESRYAAAGIAGTSTLSNLQAQSAAAQQRSQQYAALQTHTHLAQPQNPTPRPWTPTEQPGSQPHGPPTVYQGPVPTSGPPPQTLGAVHHPPPGHPIGYPQNHNPLEEDFQRMNMTSSPPPAYSSLGGPGPGGPGPHSYPNEKQGLIAATLPASMSAMSTGAMTPSTMAPHSHTPPVPNAQGHPAFANDPRQADPRNSQPNIQNGHPGIQPTPLNGSPAPPGPSPASPPPLPEGWIAHLDPNSGQYYYIHLPTQSTQWEFPKGPTPLNLNEPMSPGVSTFGGHPIASPGLSAFGPNTLASPGLSTFGHPLGSPGLPMTPGYEGSVMSMSTGFTGPPPASGVELYKVAPTNGVYFGPYLRYTNMDMERGLWLGSILLVTDAPQPPTIHMHQSVDLSPNPRQLNGVPISSHQRWTFYKYSVDLTMEEYPAKWTYAITSHLGCTRYEFLVAGRNETNWRFIATSGNDFSLGVSANERARLGGAGYMWKDIMQKHMECGGFHVHLGLGSQINADRIWKEIPSLKQWLTISGKEQRKTAVWTAAHEEDATHAYFHYYTSHFDQPHMREAFAQIPHVLQVDDHDIFDGFGSYPDYMQFSNMFKNIGRIGIEMYLLFQHHTTLEILRHVSNDMDLFTITGTGWHFVKFLGPAIAVVGPDCRSERNPHQVMAGPTYQGLFPKVASLPPSVQHCIWMISVPPIYPRLESTEHFAQTIATGKKAVTGAYNVLGKVTSSVAGVVGAKNAVGSGFNSVKRAVGKSGLMGSVLSPFGEIEILDELRDQWTHDSKDLERTYLIRTLQGIAHQKSIRMTFLSGAVNCCGAGLVHDPSHPTDHKTMYQIISSSVVNTPPPSYVMKLLHGGNKALYVPANGQRPVPGAATDTKEDMMEIFQTDVTGQPREHRKLMGRRNYVAIVGYDPENVQTNYGLMSPTTATGMMAASGAFPKLSLAVDFLVQGDGAYGNVVKFGPVIVPSLDLGRSSEPTTTPLDDIPPWASFNCYPITQKDSSCYQIIEECNERLAPSSASTPMKSLFILVVSAFLQGISGTALPEQRPDYYGDTVQSSREGRTISKELFSSLEELSRIVDITYCVGTTGVYKPFTCAGRCHEFEGFELVTTWNTGPLLSDSCGFVVLSHPPWPKRIIIGFRGTYSIANMIVDLSAIPQVYAPYPANSPTDPNQPRCNNCTVHAGFMESWQSARHTLLSPLKRTTAKYPDYQLVLVGHSLGGAVAALAGLEFQVRGWQPQVTTFGEPKVGNQGLVEYIDEIFHLKSASLLALTTGSGDTKQKTNNNKTSSYHRVTHVNDPVPLLPLSEWGYRPHAGEIYISKSDLPPEISDMQHCVGDADPECIAGSELAGKNYLLTLTPSSPSAPLKMSDGGRIGNDDDHMEGDGVSIKQQQQQQQQQLLSSGPILVGGRMQVLFRDDDNDVRQVLREWNPIPRRYRLWELLFAHRDYFWRLGVCLPSPNWGGKGPGEDDGWKWPWKWKWRWPWKKLADIEPVRW